MKHVKEIVLEKKNFKDYNKYIDIINQKFQKEISLEETMTKVYEENNSVNLFIKTWGAFNKSFFDFTKEIFGDINYFVNPKNGSQLSIDFFDIPKSALEQLEMEMIANKYNAG